MENGRQFVFDVKILEMTRKVAGHKPYMIQETE